MSEREKQTCVRCGEELTVEDDDAMRISLMLTDGKIRKAHQRCLPDKVWSA